MGASAQARRGPAAHWRGYLSARMASAQPSFARLAGRLKQFAVILSQPLSRRHSFDEYRESGSSGPDSGTGTSCHGHGRPGLASSPACRSTRKCSFVLDKASNEYSSGNLMTLDHETGTSGNRNVSGPVVTRGARAVAGGFRRVAERGDPHRLGTISSRRVAGIDIRGAAGVGPRGWSAPPSMTGTQPSRQLFVAFAAGDGGRK